MGHDKTEGGMEMGKIRHVGEAENSEEGGGGQA
jgi:hypothetical protein